MLWLIIVFTYIIFSFYVVMVLLVVFRNVLTHISLSHSSTEAGCLHVTQLTCCVAAPSLASRSQIQLFKNVPECLIRKSMCCLKLINACIYVNKLPEFPLHLCPMCLQVNSCSWVPKRMRTSGSNTTLRKPSRRRRVLSQTAVKQYVRSVSTNVPELEESFYTDCLLCCLRSPSWSILILKFMKQHTSMGRTLASLFR